MDVIQDYITKLMTRGLKAVILTGGGEPTAYKHFNDLVTWLWFQGLHVALITNGTLTNKVDPEVWAMFDWVRVSINVFPDWEKKIKLPHQYLHRDCVVGCSMVYTENHDTVDVFKKAIKVADRCNAKYIRVLPNCLLEQDKLIKQHENLDDLFHMLDDKRLFHQFKIHGTPHAGVCHQSYFRPYLSEAPHAVTGKPGTVYPCDSLVLNDAQAYFNEDYQICAAEDILKFLDREIPFPFDPREMCHGCVFTDNVNMLDDWKYGKIDRFDEFRKPLNHEVFV
jgi:organic radical activating enzyme